MAYAWRKRAAKKVAPNASGAQLDSMSRLVKENKKDIIYVKVLVHCFRAGQLQENPGNKST